MYRIKPMHAVMLLMVWSQAGWSEEAPAGRMTFPRWSPQVQGGAVHQFDTSLDEGGSFSVSRWFVEGGVARMWRYDRFVALSVGGGRDVYDFSGAPAPWDDVENQRISLFTRWQAEDRWSFFGGPSVRAYKEEGADLEDAWTAAFFAGAGYTFNERLQLGPGIGVVGQLEDRPLVFPVIVVNWGITERLRLTTGGGLASTLGPGLSLVYEQSDRWLFSLTGRYESRRFRLNRDNLASEGVGEDESTGLYGNISYKIYPRGQIAFVFGYVIDGDLEIENKSGSNIVSDGYENTVSAGLLFSFDL